MGREDNVAVFQDTEKLCKSNEVLKKQLVQEGAEVFILGAFGCGAFSNSSEVVARAAKNVVTDYMHAFKTIEFAVYCSPQDDRNFKVFERVMKNV